MMSTEELLRLTVSALMSRTGQRQGDLANAIDQAQAQVSRKQTGKQHWSLDDVDRLAAHYGMSVLDLLAGPTHAVSVLAADRLSHGAQTSIPLAPAVPVAPVVPDTFSATPLAAPPVRHPSEASESAVDAEPQPCVLCGYPARDDVDGYPQHLDPAECAAAVAAAEEAANGPATEAAPVDPAPELRPAPEPTEPAPAAAPRSAPGYASGSLVDQINAGIEYALTAHNGDVDAAKEALTKSAIPDVMALFEKSRVGGRYAHSKFPPTDGILQKKSQKTADEIWEGRPKWRNPAALELVKSGAQIEVTGLDMNAAYLSAFKTWLPIGKLIEDTSGMHDAKKSGVYLITPPEWEHADLPSPLGNRKERGELWVPDSMVRTLLDCADWDLCEAPVIHRALVSGATENLLEKMRRALAEVRKTAIAENDEIAETYVKFMYSKFVSTIGESSANTEIRRPDWMHIIRSKAFTNLWRKAYKAYKAGLMIVEMSGTDELHIAGDWRPVFPEGRDLSQVKEKKTYVLGGSR
ncbi:acyltransferase (plasmid) [Streptomyces sp. NBC_01485]|uniref:acyltransferase n=1 Tax=Streptomyces sp. NBC_01485 TaxID=2903884 RepID=UPI002E307C66|nr:acyltransferase [Streptomyces sp. NBC_01485]